MGDKPKLSPADAKAAVAEILDRLPPATRVMIKRDVIGLPPKGGFRRYRAGDTIYLILELPAEPRPGDPVET